MDEEDFPVDNSQEMGSTGRSGVYTEDGSWAVYWYLCGSDLETEGGCATTDLEEMLQVELPENVNVVIQTGGAVEWQNEYMDSTVIQRWLYNSEGLQLLEEMRRRFMSFWTLPMRIILRTKWRLPSGITAAVL